MNSNAQSLAVKIKRTTNQSWAVYFICAMCCAAIETSTVLGKDLKGDIKSGAQYKKFRPKGVYAEQQHKSNSTRKKFIPIDEYIRNKKTSKQPRPIYNFVHDKVYLKVGIGGVHYGEFKDTSGVYDKKSPKISPRYNIGIGYKLSNRVRTDLNFQYIDLNYELSESKESAKQKLKTSALFLNGYYDMNIHKTIVPYLTAGVGMGRNYVGDMYVMAYGEPFRLEGKNTTNLIWNIGGGITLKLNKRYAIDFGYIYMSLGKAKTNNSDDGELEGGKQKICGHQGTISLLYNF